VIPKILMAGLAMCLCAHAADDQRIVAPSGLQLLERSDTGDSQLTIDQLRALPHQALPEIAADLKRVTAGWVAGRPEQARRRRLVAATLALDIADVGLETEWTTLRGLVEFGCQLVRQNPAGDAEHAWFAASIALAQGAFDDTVLIDGHHIAHALGRFPNDRGFKFAQAVTIEVTVADGDGPAGYSIRSGEITTSSSDQRSKRVSSIQNLDNFQNDPGVVGAEANIRLGFLYFQNKDFEKALPFFAKARTLSDAPRLLYLSHFLEGRTFQRLGRINDAGGAFEKAWRAVPGEGAAEAFAFLLFRSARPADAYAVAAETLDRGVPDPWRLFGYGNFIELPALLADLRRLTETLR
jgi:tetratricopeptide (TPR) repeat protein